MRMNHPVCWFLVAMLTVFYVPAYGQNDWPAERFSDWGASFRRPPDWVCVLEGGVGERIISCHPKGEKLPVVIFHHSVIAQELSVQQLGEVLRDSFASNELTQREISARPFSNGEARGLDLLFTGQRSGMDVRSRYIGLSQSKRFFVIGVTSRQDDERGRETANRIADSFQLNANPGSLADDNAAPLANNSGERWTDRVNQHHNFRLSMPESFRRVEQGLPSNAVAKFHTPERQTPQIYVFRTETGTRFSKEQLAQIAERSEKNNPLCAVRLRAPEKVDLGGQNGLTVDYLSDMEDDGGARVRTQFLYVSSERELFWLMGSSNNAHPEEAAEVKRALLSFRVR